MRLMNCLSQPVVFSTFAACIAGASLPAHAVDWSGMFDIRGVSTQTEHSWTREGLGKLRYDASNAGIRLGQAILRGDADIADTVSGVLILSAADDRGAVLDVTEAWLRWNPIPSGPWKAGVKAGVFFPALSLENDGPGWTPTRTISSSAINSWIGEELRTRGLELNLVKRGRVTGEPHDIGFSATLFNGNDAAGTLMTWRGWSISDRITGLREPLRLPDLPVYRPSGEISLQSRTIHPFREIDGRLGYQLGAQYSYGGWLDLSAKHYDNRANPLIVDAGQYSWRTRFQHFSARARAQEWELLFQLMNGSTVMGPRAAGVDLRAWYLLVSHPAGSGKLTVRYDNFLTREDDAVPSDPNGEHGHSLALAYAHKLTPAWTLVLEALAVRSDRAARAIIGDTPHQYERNLTAALRWRF
ncbi:MAG: hypothetical protein HY066_07990 [Betaproteobacteria bacterium]|nr:hypothetical protein [Betaproteobacteria bacterium]